MLRTLIFCVTLLMAQAGLAQTPGAVTDLSERVWAVLDMDALMPIMQDEAIAEAAGMEETLFQRGGDGRWLAQVKAIHEPERLQTLFRDGLDDALPRIDSARIDAALDFYETPLGKRMIVLENSARQVLMDEQAEADARQDFANAARRDLPRVAQIRRLIDEADLVGPNVAGGLNAVIAFSEGFDAGGGFDMPMAEGQVLSDAWQQEPELQAETLGWLESYLLLAYSPLSDRELDDYIGFARSAEGKALSGLLFAAFDDMFRQTSYELGLAAAAQLAGREL